MSPAWVREIWSIQDRPCNAIGGGWMALKTGEWRPSPYQVKVIGGRVYVAKNEDIIVYLNGHIDWEVLTNPIIKEMIDVTENMRGQVQIYTSEKDQRMIANSQCGKQPLYI